MSYVQHYICKQGSKGENRNLHGIKALHEHIQCKIIAHTIHIQHIKIELPQITKCLKSNAQL